MKLLLNNGRKLEFLIPFLLAWFVCSSTSAVLSQNSPKEGEGQVLVIIRDKSIFLPSSVRQAFDPDVHVEHYQAFLQKDDSMYEMKYNEKMARFEQSISEGTYQLVLKDSGGGMTGYRRASILVESGRTVSVFIETSEIAADVCDKDVGFVVMVNAPPSKTDRPIRHDTWLVDKPFTMVVKYCRKKVDKERISYDRVFLTFKNVTIAARRATLNTKSFSFRGKGEVEGIILSQKEDCVKKGKSVTINLKAKEQFSFLCNDMHILGRSK